MRRVRDYIERVREAHRQVLEADDRLNSYEGDEYPEDLNDAAWAAVDRRHRVIWGKER